MAEYKQVDLQIGTEAQYETKKETLPIGTLVGITDPIHETELDSDLQTKINGILSLSDIYPVGSIYLSVNSTSPATLFGGTWEQIKDRFLLAAGDTYSAGSTGGEATHTLTVDEMPKHSHNLPVDKQYGEATTTERDRINLTSGIVYNNGYASNDTGSNQPHNNMPPYLTVYMWKRIN